MQLKKFIFLTIFTINTSYSHQNKMVKNRVLGDANWGTHMPVLFTAVANTNGPILEFGCGDYSTTLLHAICSANKRYILSLESDKNWLQNFIDLETSWHNFLYIPLIDENNNVRPEMWNLAPIDKHWAVVFIDHHPGPRRVVDIERFKNNADVIVVHDTNKEDYYKYQPSLSKFKYKYLYERYERTTTIVSNFIDVNNFFIEKN